MLRMTLRGVLIWCGIANLAALLVVPAFQTRAVPSSGEPREFSFSPWIAWWQQTRGLGSLRRHPGAVTSVSPYWYVFRADGELVSLPNANAPEFMAAIRELQLPLIPTISNADSQTNEKSGTLAAHVLGDPRRRDRHIAAILEVARKHRYAGIDIDYEQLPPNLRHAFATFVAQLASGLHAEGRVLAVTVPPKVREPGGDNGSQAMDYAVIGAAADVVRVMAYDYSWETSAPGPVAPLGWVEAVAAHAVTLIPSRRVELGVALYGYDWVRDRGTSKMWDELDAIARRHGAVVQWDRSSGSPWFAYISDGQRHIVWFENAESFAYKLDLARRLGLGGVAAWRLGGEDPRVWKLLTRPGGRATSSERE